MYMYNIILYSKSQGNLIPKLFHVEQFNLQCACPALTGEQFTHSLPFKESFLYFTLML